MRIIATGEDDFLGQMLRLNVDDIYVVLSQPRGSTDKTRWELIHIYDDSVTGDEFVERYAAKEEETPDELWTRACLSAYSWIMGLYKERKAAEHRSLRLADIFSQMGEQMDGISRSLDLMCGTEPGNISEDQLKHARMAKDSLQRVANHLDEIEDP